MNHEVTLANARWCREQAAKYNKLANAIEEILQGTTEGVLPKPDVNQRALFEGNNPLPTFEQVQKAAEKGGRVAAIAVKLKATTDHVRDMLTTPNSQFYIGGAGWIRRKGEADPFKK